MLPEIPHWVTDEEFFLVLQLCKKNSLRYLCSLKCPLQSICFHCLQHVKDHTSTVLRVVVVKHFRSYNIHITTSICVCFAVSGEYVNRVGVNRKCGATSTTHMVQMDNWRVSVWTGSRQRVHPSFSWGKKTPFMMDIRRK